MGAFFVRDNFHQSNLQGMLMYDVKEPLGVRAFYSMIPTGTLWTLFTRGVTIHKSHNSVRTLVFKSCFFFFFLLNNFFLFDLTLIKCIQLYQTNALKSRTRQDTHRVCDNQ